MKKTLNVVITGASSGIGEACAFEFAKLGANLILGARRIDKLKALEPRLFESGSGSVSSFSLDVCSEVSVNTFIENISTSPAAKSVDILVNNAGLALGNDRIASGSMNDWQSMIETNVIGLLRVTRGLLPQMLERKSGHVINMGSIAGFVVYEGGSVYCASKHAVRAITKTLRLEVHGTPIRVTSIDPGMVETEFSVVRFRDEIKAKNLYEGLKPLTAKDIADAVVWSATRPSHVNIEEIVLMPVAQAAPHKVDRSFMVLP